MLISIDSRSLERMLITTSKDKATTYAMNSWAGSQTPGNLRCKAENDPGFQPAELIGEVELNGASFPA